MISNFREVLNKPGFYSASLLSPPCAVVFHFHAWLPEIEVAPVAGSQTEPFRVRVDKLMDVRWIHDLLKSLPKSE